MEQTTIQEIRLCVREHDENGKLHISCVWDLRGEIDAVALAQLKLQEDMPIASVSHSTHSHRFLYGYHFSLI